MSVSASSFERPDLASKVSALPHRPGVYLFRDRLNRVIYVGKARDLQRRVSQYFHPSRRATADLKTRALIDSIWDVETHAVKSEPESLLLEGRLIKEFRPRYNVSFRDDKRFLLVKVNLQDPYPRFQLTRMRKDDACRYFGPFAHSGALRATLNLLKKKFHIRSCHPLLPGERDFKHCLDHIIRNCSAPCVGRVSHAQYLSQVKLACEFLDGHSREMLEELRADMRKAAENLDFEKAAMLRNLLDDLRKTARPMRRFTREIPATVLPAADMRALGEALGLPAPPLHIECFDISNISTTHKVASMVVFRNGRPDRYHYRRYRIRSVEGQDDFASIEEAVRRRYTRVLGLGPNSARPSQEAIEGRLPDLIMVDGGRGQVSAAVKALASLRAWPAPLIGLAKENEEVFRPGIPDPLVLPRDSGALRLLQRIRDEAHRVANEYHQLLLARRVSESLLDDCPGVSETRKAALLREFGSVKRLRAATVEAIAAVPGIGPRLAGDIIAFLARTL